VTVVAHDRLIGMRRALGWVGTIATVTAEVVTIGALVALGRDPTLRVPSAHLEHWLRVTPPADAVIAVLRWVALVGAWWLLAGTLLYLVAAATRVPAAVRAVRWAALPPVRRVVDAAFVVTVVGGAVLAPVSAHAIPSATGSPRTTLVRDGRAGDLTSLPPQAAPAPPVPPAPTAPVTVIAAEVQVTVAPGDDLWELSAHRVAAVRGRSRDEVADAEIAPYWLTVCERNRGTLASGDPNVLFPGEVVTLPAVS